MRSYTSVDLFAGAGGFSAGLLAAGFRCCGVVEKSAPAGASFARNFSDCPVKLLGAEKGDITRIQPSFLIQSLQSAGISEIDLLVACPPCQGFSRVGRGKLLSLSDSADAFLNDPRNDLYLHAIKMLQAIRPRAFLFENVAGMLHLRGRNMVEPVCEAIERSGYRVQCALLNSAWYGVPQTRERVFIIGIRKDLNIAPTFPEVTHYIQLSRGHFADSEHNPRNWKVNSFFVPSDKIARSSTLSPATTTAEAFADLPPFLEHLSSKSGTYSALRKVHSRSQYLQEEPPNEYCALMRDWMGHFASEGITDHYCRNTPRDFETFARMQQGDRYPDACRIAEALYMEALQRWNQGDRDFPRRRDFIPPYSQVGFADKWRKLISSQPSWTVTAHLSKDTYSHIHYDSSQKRMITVREAARLQSFPDGFSFVGSTGDVLRQIGNAVPPLLALAIGASVYRVLRQHDSRAHEGASLPIEPAAQLH